MSNSAKSKPKKSNSKKVDSNKVETKKVDQEKPQRYSNKEVRTRQLRRIMTFGSLSKEALLELQDWWVNREPVQFALDILQKYGVYATPSEIERECAKIFAQEVRIEEDQKNEDGFRLPDDIQAVNLIWRHILVRVRSFAIMGDNADEQLLTVASTIHKIAIAQEKIEKVRADRRIADDKMTKHMALIKQQIENEIRSLVSQKPELMAELQEIINQVSSRMIEGQEEAIN